MSQQLTLTPSEQVAVATQIDSVVAAFFGDANSSGFAKTYNKSNAMMLITEALTPEYMKPIMFLQNKKNGFRTDSKEGYGIDKVKECLIEATMLGLEADSNHWNILGSNMYVTREGFEYLLRKIRLWYRFTHNLPAVVNGQTTVTTKIEWKDRTTGELKEYTITQPVKADGAKTDAILGKADRKCAKWLYREVTGNDVADADVTEGIAEIVSSTPTKQPVRQTQQQAPAPSDEIVTAPSKNDHHEEATIVEDKSPEQLSADAMFEKCPSKEKLEIALKQVQKAFPTVDLTFYNQKLASYEGK